MSMPKEEWNVQQPPRRRERYAPRSAQRISRSAARPVRVPKPLLILARAAQGSSPAGPAPGRVSCCV